MCVLLYKFISVAMAAILALCGMSSVTLGGFDYGQKGQVVQDGQGQYKSVRHDGSELSCLEESTEAGDLRGLCRVGTDRLSESLGEAELQGNSRFSQVLPSGSFVDSVVGSADFRLYEGDAAGVVSQAAWIGIVARIGSALMKSKVWASTASGSLIGCVGIALTARFACSSPAVASFAQRVATSPAIVQVLENPAYKQAIPQVEKTFVDEALIIDAAFCAQRAGVPAAQAESSLASYVEAEVASVISTGNLVSGSGGAIETMVINSVIDGTVPVQLINSNPEFCLWLAQVITGESYGNVVDGSPVVGIGNVDAWEDETTGISYNLASAGSSEYESWFASVPNSEYSGQNNGNYQNLRGFEAIFSDGTKGFFAITYVDVEGYTFGDSNWINTVSLTSNHQAMSAFYHVATLNNGVLIDNYIGATRLAGYPPVYANVDSITYFVQDCYTVKANVGTVSGYTAYSGYNCDTGNVFAQYNNVDYDLTAVSGGTVLDFLNAADTIIGNNAVVDSGGVTDWGTVDGKSLMDSSGDWSQYQQDGHFSTIDSPASEVNADTPIVSGEPNPPTVGDMVDGSGSTPTDDNASFVLGDLTKVFPFCIPFDIYALLALFAAPPQAPVFTWEFSFSFMETQSLTIDLSEWETLAAVMRALEFISFCIGLAFLTKDLINANEG